MSSSSTLGSIILEPVMADIVCFMEQQDKRKFSLLSPSANKLVHDYRVFKRIYARCLALSADEDNNLIVYLDYAVYNNNFNTMKKAGTEQAYAFIDRMLGMCTSIGHLKWGNNESFKCIFNEKVYNKLKKLDLGHIDLYGRINLSGDQLLGLRSQAQLMNLFGCQISNDLVTDKIFQKLCEKKMYVLNVNRVPTTNENSTSLSDAFLNVWIKSQRYTKISLGNFHTKFTTQGIKRVFLAFPFNMFDFGFLDVNQNESAHAYLMEMSRPIYTLQSEIQILDGGYSIRYEISRYGTLFISFSLSLLIATNLSSKFSANIEEEMYFKSRILTSLFLSDNAKTPETKQVRICYNRILNIWTNSLSDVLRFELIVADSYKRNFVLIDIDKQTAAKVIKTCLSECEKVDQIYWDQLDFSDDVYAILKTVSDTIVGFEWSHTTLSSQNLVEFFREYPQIAVNFFYNGKRFEESELSSKYLTNEIVYYLLENGVTIDVIWIGEKNEAVTTLNDHLLVLLAERNSPSAIRLSIKGYRTDFTIQGIETLALNLIVIESMDPLELSFTLDDSEEVNAIRFLTSIQLNPESVWRIVAISRDGSFLQSFKITSKVHRGIYIDVDFHGIKKTVDEKSNAMNQSEIGWTFGRLKMDSSAKKESDSQTGSANSEISKIIEKHFEGFTALNPSAKCLNLLEAYRQHYLDENTYNKDGETVKEEFANWDEQLIAEVDWVHLVELCCAAKYMEMNDLNDICLNKILHMQKDVGEEECRKGFEMMAKWNPDMS